MGPRKNLSPDRIWTHDLPKPGRTLYPLNYENSWRAKSFNWVLTCRKGRMSCKNSVKWPGSPGVLVAQWIERPPGLRKVMGSNPIGTQIFPRSHARVTLFPYLFTELQFHYHSFVSTFIKLHKIKINKYVHLGLSVYNRFAEGLSDIDFFWLSALGFKRKCIQSFSLKLLLIELVNSIILHIDNCCCMEFKLGK